MKNSLIQQDAIVMSLETLNETVALEAFSFSGMANRVADIIPNLVYSFKRDLKPLTDKLDLTRMDVNKAALTKAINAANYTEIGDIYVSVPQGFVGAFSEYIPALGKAVTFTNDVTSRLTEFNQLLSILISDKQSRMSSRDHAVASNKLEKEREEIRSALAVFFKATSRSSRAKLSEVYQNCNEILSTVDTAGEVIMLANAITLKEVESLISTSVELLNAISDKAEKRQLEGLSPEALKSLASSCLTAARDVELHSHLMHQTWQLKHAIQKNAQELTKALRY